MYKLIYNGETEKNTLRNVWGKTFCDMMAEDEKVVFVDSDLIGCWNSKELKERFGNRVLEAGIAEANMVAAAAAMSLTGLKPYVHSFAVFAVRRAFDQIFISAAYAKKNLHIIGSDPGISQTSNGGTHMCFEDLALMQTIPNITIFDVTDGVMFDNLIKKTKDLPGVFYFRASRTNKGVYGEGSDFEISKGNVLREGTDATVISCGCMVCEALRAADLLAADGISVRVIDMFTVKPLDTALVLDSAEKTGAIVTAENHSVYGGLGSAVAQLLCETGSTARFAQVAVKNKFGEVGDEDYLRKAFSLTAEEIVKNVKELIGKK